MTSNNRGIVITGGALNAENIAVGDHAQLVQGSAQAPAADFLQRLDAIEAAIEQHRSLLRDPEDLKVAVSTAKAEANRTKPNHRRVVELLEEIGAAAASAAPVVALIKSALAVFQQLR